MKLVNDETITKVHHDDTKKMNRALVTVQSFFLGTFSGLAMAMAGETYIMSAEEQRCHCPAMKGSPSLLLCGGLAASHSI